MRTPHCLQTPACSASAPCSPQALSLVLGYTSHSRAIFEAGSTPPPPPHSTHKRAHMLSPFSSTASKHVSALALWPICTYAHAILNSAAFSSASLGQLRGGHAGSSRRCRVSSDQACALHRPSAGADYGGWAQLPGIGHARALQGRRFAICRRGRRWGWRCARMCAAAGRTMPWQAMQGEQEEAGLALHMHVRCSGVQHTREGKRWGQHHLWTYGACSGV